jgi:hypothetical protein
MPFRNCKLDPTRLGALAECLTGCDFQNRGGEWPGHFLSTRTVAYSCGILARDGDAVVHAHPAQEVPRCRRLANQAAKIMQGVYIRWGDESDHRLSPFWITANVGDSVPKHLTEKVYSTAMRGTVYPGAILTVEPFKESSSWFTRVTQLDLDYWGGPEVDPDCVAKETARADQWRRLFHWFRSHPDLHSPVYIGFKPNNEEFASVYPQLFLALTASGSLVGLATCVVWT